MTNAIYIRTREGSASFQEQADLCIKFINPDNETEIYCDTNLSAAHLSNRPEMQRLITDVTEGKINMVLAYDLKCLSRNIEDFNELLQLLKQHNVMLNIGTENTMADLFTSNTIENLVDALAQMVSFKKKRAKLKM